MCSPEVEREISTGEFQTLAFTRTQKKTEFLMYTDLYLETFEVPSWFLNYCKKLLQAPVVQRLDNFIRWIMDKVIQPLNNWGQMYN